MPCPVLLQEGPCDSPAATPRHATAWGPARPAAPHATRPGRWHTGQANGIRELVVESAHLGWRVREPLPNPTPPVAPHGSPLAGRALRPRPPSPFTPCQPPRLPFPHNTTHLARPGSTPAAPPPAARAAAPPVCRLPARGWRAAGGAGSAARGAAARRRRRSSWGGCTPGGQTWGRILQGVREGGRKRQLHRCGAPSATAELTQDHTHFGAGNGEQVRCAATTGRPGPRQPLHQAWGNGC